MKVSVFTITCNRLELTKKWLSQLRLKAGNVPYNHFVVDNGSTDGTLDWLLNNGYTVLKLDKNYGILPAMKIGIQYAIDKYDADYIVKFDNDCEIITDGALQRLIGFFESGCKSCVLAPLDTEILQRQMPKMFYTGNERGENVRYTRHVGGIFKAMSRLAASILLKAPEDSVNGDLKRGDYWKSKGIDTIYLTDVKVAHRGAGNQTRNYNLG